MLNGLQAGFGAPLGATLLADLRERGFSIIRLDLQQTPDGDTARDLIAEVREAGLRPLVIIRPEQAPWLSFELPLDVEVYNEPDLAGWHPQRYRDTVRGVLGVLGERHRIWAGGVSNSTPGCLNWLIAATMELPPNVGIAVHRYPKNGARPDDPQVGFVDREAEMRAIQRVVGTRRWGVSETGYHTGPQKTGAWFWAKRWHWTDAQIADFARQELAWWRTAGADFMVFYQLNDGLGSDPLDRFGIRYATGEWKPVADSFQTSPTN